MKKLMMMAGLIFAVAPLALLAATDCQMVYGGYYFVEGSAGSLNAARMSIDGDGVWANTPPPGLVEGQEVTFKASPEPGLRIAQWGTLIHATSQNDARNYKRYTWTTTTKDEMNWRGKPADGAGYLAVNFKYIDYNVRYDANDGTGAPDSVNGVSYDEPFNLPSTTPTKTGFDFSGWKPDTKTDKIYSAGQEVSGVDLCPDDWHEDGKTVTLVAQWSRSAPSFTLEQVAQAEWKAETTVTVSTAVKIGDTTLDKDKYEYACEYYGIPPKTEPTAEDFKVVSKDAQLVQEGEIAVTKESIQAAKAETVEIANGVVYLGVSVLSNSDITASTAWAPVKFPENPLVYITEDGTKLILPIPASAKQGFMILQSGDAKVSEGGVRVPVTGKPWYTPTVED